MTVLVTGSAGHLGEGLVRTLRAQGRRVVGLDRNPSPWTDVVGSIVERDVVRAALRGVSAVIHAATLHKPHVGTHARADFVATNIAGTLNLLEESAAAGVRAFVYTSTTSAFGDALSPPPDAPAAWIDERVVPVPKNIYGVTKLAAEQLCELFRRNQGLSCIVLRTSRFFPEPDDAAAVRRAYADANAKVNELAYRRADLADVVDAHLLALQHAPRLGFGRYIVSAPTPFTREDLAELRRDAPAVLRRRVPAYAAAYARLGWRMFPAIDRVYDAALACRDLGWRPAFDFAAAVARLDAGDDWRSPLALAVGAKGYHADLDPERYGLSGDAPYPA